MTVDITFHLLVHTAFNEYSFPCSFTIRVVDMELNGSMQEGATRPVTGPPLRRSPEALDPRDPVAEVRGGSRAADRLKVEAGVPATINTNLHPILHRFELIADYWSNLRFRQRGTPLTHSFSRSG